MMGYLTAPRLAFGPGALEQLGALELRRVALLVDPALASAPRVERVREELARTEARVEEFHDLVVEPTVESVERAAERLRATSPDAIVALGGGSVLDAAKGAWLRYEAPELPLAQVTPLAELGLRRRARLIAIPTTTGSGSEANGLAQFHRDDGPLLELGVRELAPDWGLLDPYFLTTLPPAARAEGGVDALAHALEAVASEWANPFTDALAREAVAVLLRELPRTLKRPGDLEPLAAIQAAAAMGGLAVANAQVGATHALAHALQAAFGLPHARTVGVLLPYVLEFNFPSARERYATLQASVGPGPLQSRSAFGQRFRVLAEQLALPRSLAQAGLPAPTLRAGMDRAVEFAAASPGLVGNPRMPSREELRAILEAAAEGTALPG